MDHSVPSDDPITAPEGAISPDAALPHTHTPEETPSEGNTEPTFGETPSEGVPVPTVEEGARPQEPVEDGDSATAPLTYEERAFRKFIAPPPLPEKVAALATAAPAEVRQVPWASVVADPDQPRQQYNFDNLAILADDIARHGIELPLLVRREEGPSGEDRYRLIAGERRLRAAKLAGLTHVPVLVREGITEQEAVLLQLRENLMREDLNPMDEARGIHRYKEVSGKSWKAVAQELGWVKQTVLARVKLLKAPEAIQSMIKEGQLQPSYYQEVSALDEGEQVRLMERAVSEGLTIAALRRERDLGRKAGNGGKGSPAQGHLSDGDQAGGDSPSAAEEGLGTVTPAAEEDLVTEVNSDMRGDGEEESNKDQTADPHDETNGHDTETSDTEKGVEATKELRVSLDAAVYARLEQRAEREGKSIRGFARQLLTEAADSLNGKRALHKVDHSAAGRLINEKIFSSKPMRQAA